MTNSAEQLIYHAAILLDRDDVPGAVTTLEEAIELATVADRKLELLRARFLLGELFAATGRIEEAVEQYENVLEIGDGYPERSLVDEELVAARARLEELLPPDPLVGDAGAHDH